MEAEICYLDSRNNTIPLLVKEQEQSVILNNIFKSAITALWSICLLQWLLLWIYEESIDNQPYRTRWIEIWFIRNAQSWKQKV